MRLTWCSSSTWPAAGPSPARRQEHLEPTWTGSDLLPRVLGSPTLGEADADGVDVDGAGSSKACGLAATIATAAVWKLQDLGAVEDVETETRWYSVHEQCPRFWVVQGGRIHENRTLRPVIRPYTVRLLAERQTCDEMMKD